MREKNRRAQPLVAALDDTLLRRGGRKSPGVGWRRDPLGPPFAVNFVRAQRSVQLSAALPHDHSAGAARLLPIAFSHAPTPTIVQNHVGHLAVTVNLDTELRENLPIQVAHFSPVSPA